MQASPESRKIVIKELNHVIEEMYSQKKKLFAVIDKSGVVETFMKYQGPNIWSAEQGALAPETVLKKFLVSAHFGTWLVMNFGDLPVENNGKPLFGTDTLPWKLFDIEWMFTPFNLDEFQKEKMPDAIEKDKRLVPKDSFKVMMIASKNVFPSEILSRVHFIEVVSDEEKKLWEEQQEAKAQTAKQESKEEVKSSGSQAGTKPSGTGNPGKSTVSASKTAGKSTIASKSVSTSKTTTSPSLQKKSPTTTATTKSPTTKSPYSTTTAKKPATTTTTATKKPATTTTSATSAGAKTGVSKTVAVSKPKGK